MMRKPAWKTIGLATGVGVFGLAAFLAGRAWAGGVPATGALTYSGTLEDATGAPLTGNHNIQVNFWGAASGGTTTLCSTTSASVAIDEGRFSVALPDTCATAVKGSPSVWAEVLVDGNSLGRTKIGAVPYALEAGEASGATGALATQIAGLAPANAVPVITAWTPYTPAINDSAKGLPIGADTSASGEYRRVGDTVEVHISGVVGPSGITNNGALAFSYPSAAPPDATKLPSGSNSQVVGTGNMYHVASGANYGGSVFFYKYLTALAMNIQGGGTILSTTNPVTLGVGDSFELQFSYPVQGWTTTGP